MEKVLVQLFTLVTNDSPQKEWDNFLAEIWAFDIAKKVAFNILRIHNGGEQKTVDWWKTLFRRILDFSKLKNKSRSELLKLSQPICDSYTEIEVTTIFTELVFAMTKNG